MSYSDFEASIKSSALQHVAAHWDEARQSRSMPSWPNINPAKIAAHLSIVWSFRYDADTGEFTGRLVGEHIARHIGKDFRNLRLDEAYPPDAFVWAAPLFKRVVTEPALYAHLGIAFTQLDRPGAGERIVLPLSSDGITADGVLGATVFDHLYNAPMTLVAPTRDAERWYSLR
jgi:hypothetical protein